MTGQLLRVMAVVRRSTDISSLRLEDIDGLDIVALGSDIQADPPEDTIPDVLLIDITFPNNRSIDAIRDARDEYPDTAILALTPEPASYELVVLAIEAGALGFVVVSDGPAALSDACRQVSNGQPWLPPNHTLDVLQDVSAELEVTATERTSKLWSVILALVPILGATAAFLSFIWRKYWGHIGVRPVDIAIDPATRLADLLIALGLMVGVFGPLLLITGWLDALTRKIEQSPRARERLDRLQHLTFVGIPIGRFVFSRQVAWVVVAATVLIVTLSLAAYASLVMILIIGPLIGVAMLARALDLEDELPPILRMGRLRRGSLLAGTGVVVILVALVLGREAFITGPDLRTDGVHGILAGQVLGFSAQPVTATTVDGSRSPFDTLYLGGNADLYVLYNPCTDVVEFVSVGSTRITVIEEVSCPGA
jgi:hypothetical protein